MDQMLERLNKIYPNGKYVLISKYDPSVWKDKEYDSKFDRKEALNRWMSKPLTYFEAQERVEEGFRIGWIPPVGMVVVDIDNEDDPRSQEKIEHILRKFEVKYSYNYTSRGMHLLFKDPSENIKTGARMKCGLNIVIDTRANGTGYIILPCNDPHRKWGQWNDFVENIPYFLKPILKDVNNPTFIGMSEGDGRNDVLFKWRKKLEQTRKLTEAEVEKTLRTINEYIFDTPIPNNELFKTVLRKMDAKVEDEEKINIYNKYAEQLLEKVDMVSYYDTFYVFNGTYYRPVSETELEMLIYNELSNNLSQVARREIRLFLKLKTQRSLDDFDSIYYKIACKNGVINLLNGELEPPNKNEINTIFIPWNYNPNPKYSPRIDQFMKDLTNADPLKMEFLYQIAGYCLLKQNCFHKFFIMLGEGGTGKSTYTNIIQKMVNDSNCSHVALSDMNKDYYLASMMGKLVNIDDDVGDTPLEYSGRFKSMVSGERISVRQIYRAVEDHKSYATLIFNSNKMPKIMDRTSGLYRRIVLIELNHKIDKPDSAFMDKLVEQDMEYFLFKAVQGIVTALTEAHFRIDYSEEKLLNMFKRRQSPVNEWLYENEITLGDLQDKDCAPLYTQFADWCTRNGYMKVMTSFSFREEIRTIYDMEVTFIKSGAGTKMLFHKRGQFDPNYRPF